MHLLQLPDSILLYLLETCPYVTRLATTCKRLFNTWHSMPSARANWLLRCCPSSSNALDLSISYVRDLEVSVNLLSRGLGLSPLWLSHVLVDLCRIEIPCGLNARAKSKLRLSDSVESLLLNTETSDWALNAARNEDLIVKLNPRTVASDDSLPNRTQSVSHREEIRNMAAIPKLIIQLIDSGADLNADMTLYVKSLVFGAGQDATPLIWLLNEWNRLAAQRQENQVFGIDDINEEIRMSAGFISAFYCIYYGSLAPLQALVVRGNVSLNLWDGFLVLVAARDGHREILEFIKRTEGSSLMSSRDGYAQKLAARNGHEDCLYLFEASNEE